MTKRVVSVILILLLLLPAVISAGGLLFSQKSPFSEFDENREASVNDALKSKIDFKKQESDALGEENRYIVKFNDSISDTQIENALDGYDYRLLAESKNRLFAVVVENDSFFEENKTIIDYQEPDLKREVLAVTDDPIVSESYEALGIYEAWDNVTAKSDVIVAVLDTGINREHEDLKDAKILAGYDAVERTAGINIDTAGHGTSVIGIIAATPNNRLGIAGVAHGVTILPIRVSSSGTTIYSSDLIAGIRFAADSGAKIINMSVGGYSSSYAEQEAVNYAIEKGCILISAAGNGGNRPYADQKSYPASYDGVISVGSHSPNGERSDFSQYNDSVDISAPGEMITVPYFENGESLYKTDSGTSYSCAIVSGIAALALSKINENARFDSDEFLYLLIDAFSPKRTDEFGYGKINATEILRRINLPIVTGIYNNGIFSDSVKIGFNRGTALLDDEPFEDGETVISNGNHTLTVTDGEVSRSFYFRLNYNPISFKFKEFSQFSYFEFDRGTATLNGFPYKSGEYISASGKHEFILKDGDEILTKEFNLQYSLPTVYGIEDGATYNHPVDIRIVGDGFAELDDSTVYEEITVAENGVHTLVVRSGNRAITKEYKFTIEFEEAKFTDFDYEFSNAVIDEDNEYFCIYGDSLVGARIYNIEAPEKFLYFLPIGRIYTHRLTEDFLYLAGDNGITVISRENATDQDQSIVKRIELPEIEYYLFAEDRIFCFGNQRIYEYSLENENLLYLAELGFDFEAAYYDNGLIAFINSEGENLIRFFDIENVTVSSFEAILPPKLLPVCFSDGYISVGNRLYNVSNGEIVLEFCSEYAIRIENDLLFTDNRIIDIESGKEVGSFPFPVADIVSTNDKNYIFGQEAKFVTVNKNAEGITAFSAAKRTDKAFSQYETVNEYRNTLFFAEYSNPISISAGDSTLYMLFEDKPSIYSINTKNFDENEPVALRYFPNEIFVSGGYVAVSFKNQNKIYLASEADLSNGLYINLPSRCYSAVIVNNRLFAVCNGKLVYCDTSGAQLTETEISAKSVKTDGERVYVLSASELKVYNQSLTSSIGIEIEADEFFIGSGIAVNGKIYDRNFSSVFANLNDKVNEFHSNVIITDSGIYDLIKNEYVGALSVKNPLFSIICGDNSVVLIGNGIIDISSFADNREIVSKPNIEGVTEGNSYLDHTSVYYDLGVGFIDGERVESGYTVNKTGKHILTIVLPFGHSVSVEFNIEAQIENIEFLVGNRTMSVGEKVTLRIKYLPDGASSVPVRFESDSDNLQINEGGEVLALEVGEYKVTAIAEAEYGSFRATCIITVRDDLIVFKDDNNIKIDRDNGFVFGVSAGTTVESLLEMLRSKENVSVIDANGNKVKNFVGTGDKIVLVQGNETTDILSLVIIGDTDGDGCITAYDIYTLERVLRGYNYETPYVLASDINRNGILADNDYRELRNMILSASEPQITPPDESLFGLATVQTLSYIESGGYIDVAICISGCKYARGISGIIQFGEGLEFIEGLSTGWESYFKVNGNEVGFYAYSKDGKECGTAFSVVIGLRFRVISEAGKTVSFKSNGLKTAFSDGCRILRFENKEVFVYETATGDFEIQFFNARSFVFYPETYEYSTTIPYNSALADISVKRAIGQTISVSDLIIDSTGEARITVMLYSLDGSNKIYTIQVKRDSEPRFDSNCRLRTLEIEGFKLSPLFNPEIFEYTISVPNGTEKINIYCVAQNPTATVIIGDTHLKSDNESISITVGTPDGETLIYTVNVKILPPDGLEPDTSEPIEDEENGVSASTLITIIVGIIAAIVLIVFYVRIYKNDAENKAKELDASQVKPESIDEQSEQTQSDADSEEE